MHTTAAARLRFIAVPRWMLVALLALTPVGLAALLCTSATAQQGGQIITADQAARTVDVVDVTTRGHQVSGRVVNKSNRPLRAVRLMVNDAWMWKNERHPGTDNPGRTSYVNVPGTIPSDGSAPFECPRPAQATARQDGHLKLSVQVSQYLEVTGADEVSWVPSPHAARTN